MRQSLITLQLHKYTPVKILVKSSVNLFKGQLYYGYYKEAFRTLDQMHNIQGINLPDEIEAQFVAKLENKLNSNAPMKVTGKLTPLGKWIYKNSLQKFEFNNVIGIIESVEIRCTIYQNHRARHQPIRETTIPLNPSSP
jgi:hypothetical protein